MRLSHLHYKSQKNPDDFTDNPYLKWMIKSGLIKYDSSIGSLYTPFGRVIHAYVTDTIKEKFALTPSLDSYEIEGFFSDEDHAIDALFQMTKFDYKSYKVIPTTLSTTHQGLKTAPHFDFTNLYLLESGGDTRGFQKKIIDQLNHITDYGVYFVKQKPILKTLFYTDAIGEDDLLACDSCGFGDLHERVGVPKRHIDPEVTFLEEATVKQGVVFDGLSEKIVTPDTTSIESLTHFLNLKDHEIMKAIALIDEDEHPTKVLLSGDKTLNLLKLSKKTGKSYRLASDEEIKTLFCSEVGYLGPMLTDDPATIIVDLSILPFKNYCVGANLKDHHLLGLQLKAIEKSRYFDVSEVNEGDPCPVCGHRLKQTQGSLVAILKDYDTKLSENHRANYLNASGKAERHHAIGLHLSLKTLEIISFAKDACLGKDVTSYLPFDLWLMTLNAKKNEQVQLGEKAYELMLENNLRLVYDDRVENAGTKFFDSEIFSNLPLVIIGKDAEDGFLTYLKGEVKNEKLKIDDLFLWVESH